MGWSMGLAAAMAAAMAAGAGGALAAASSLPPLSLDEVSFHSQPKGPAGQFYPADALKARISGHATALCTVEASGDLGDCTVTEETPPGYGFGAKVLLSAQYIRVYALSKYGAPTKGRFIVVPMKFTPPPGA